MSPHIATSEAESPVPTESTTAQATTASRLFFDASRGGWVFERGPERLNVLFFPPPAAPGAAPQTEATA